MAEAELVLPGAPFWQLADDPQAAYLIRAQRIISAHLPSYRRQYAGFYDGRGQPCLFINFFPYQYTRLSGSDWLRYYIGVDDGGAAFWHICYNLATYQFSDFSPNPKG